MLVKKSTYKDVKGRVFGNPARTIVCSFLLLQAIGTVLLMLPISLEKSGSLSFLEALFTSVSATCVTGLSVHGSLLFFTDFGKAVILFLVQVGALGLVTLATTFFSIFHGRLKNRSVLMAQESTDVLSFTNVKSLFRFIFFVTISFELLGTVVFSFQFIPRYGVGRGLFYSFFQSVSAFCNAGFDFSGSIENGTHIAADMFNGHPVILLTTAILTIFGGVGFVVWQDFFSFRKTKRLHFHTKIILCGTVLLLLLGTFGYMLLEWGNISKESMGTLPSWQRPFAAFFLSVNMRSAGYSSLRLSALSDGSKLLSIFLMFIGAGPGSVGGGIRITTFSVLIFSVLSEIRGEKDVLAGKRRIGESTVKRSLSILFFTLSMIFLLSFLLCFIESDSILSGEFSFLDILFESTATLSTTGLSTLGTKNFSELGQICIIPFMLIGRIGPLTLALSILAKEKKSKEYLYPEGNILLG